MFFIDGASLIENSDPKWEVLLAVGRKPEGGSGGPSGHVVMGIQTMYNFWSFPEHLRRTARSGSVRSEDEVDIQDFKRLRLSQVT